MCHKIRTGAHPSVALGADGLPIRRVIQFMEASSDHDGENQHTPHQYLRLADEFTLRGRSLLCGPKTYRTRNQMVKKNWRNPQEGSWPSNVIPCRPLETRKPRMETTAEGRNVAIVPGGVCKRRGNKSTSQPGSVEASALCTRSNSIVS